MQDYSDHKKIVGKLTKDSSVLSSSLLSNIVNECYVVSSYNELPDSNDSIAIGTIGIVSSLIVDDNEDLSSRTAYYWTGETWAALNGNYNASNVYFDRNIEMTQQFGHHEVPLCGHYTLDAKGKSILSILEEAYQVAKSGSKTEPILTYQIGSYTANKEVGYTYVIPSLSLIVNSVGSYQYGTATNSNEVENTGISIAISHALVKTPEQSAINYTAYLSSNAANKILSCDNGTITHTYTDSEDSYNYYVSADWLSGDIPLNNIGTPDPNNTLPSGNYEKITTIKFKGQRFFFWGFRKESDGIYDIASLNSDDIRSGIGTKDDANRNTYGTSFPSTPTTTQATNFTVPAGTKQIIFAAPHGSWNKKISVFNNSSKQPLSFDNNDQRMENAVNVDGYNHHTAMAYDIWYRNFTGSLPTQTNLAVSWI